MILFSKSSADGITAEIAIIQSVIDDSLNIISPPLDTYIIHQLVYKVKGEMKEFIDKSKNLVYIIVKLTCEGARLGSRMGVG